MSSAECATTGCTNDPEAIVVFDDPDEEVEYCRQCAAHNWLQNSKASEIHEL